MSRKYTDLTAADEVCTVIHGEWNFMVVAMQREDGSHEVRSVWKRYGTLEQLKPVLVDWHGKGLEVYMLVPVSDGKGYANASIRHTWALAADFDDGLPPEIRADSPVAPTFVVGTSPGRYHVVWLLDQPCDPDTARRASVVLAERLGGDPAFARKGQLVRLPGFVNQKYGDHTVRLVDAFSRREPYALETLMEAFDAGVVTATLRSNVASFDASLAVSREVNDKEHVIEDVKSALEYLGEHAEEYGDWVRILMALVLLGEEGRVIARDFSQRCRSKFDPQAFDAKWEALQGSAGSVATIFALAQREGWRNPGFRNEKKIDVCVLTDRDFGRMIAEEIGDHYAATEIYAVNQPRTSYVLQAWNGEAFAPPAHRERRLAIEQAGGMVVARLREKGLEKAAVTRRLHQLGSNRSLEEISEHVAEALIPRSLGRTLTQYPYLGVQNGVLNLITRTLVPTRYRVLSPLQAGVRYESSARAPLFEKTIREIFEEDEEMVAFMYRVMGYMLLGKPNAQIFLIFLGESGSNGKSVLTEILSFILGEYAMVLPTTSIMTKSHVSDGATPTLAGLQQRRLAVVSEPNPKHELDSGAIKQMTGDRRMNVRANYGPPKDILIEFVLLMVTNRLPAVKADDNGLWRRIQIVPFNRKFGPDEIDPDLIEKLRAEASGILNILLDGASDYLRGGLRVPEKIRAVNQQQRHEVDPVELFIEDALIRDEGAETELKYIYECYLSWRKSSPQFPLMSRQGLRKALEDKGFQKITRGNLHRFIGLLPAAPPGSA